VKTRPSIPPLGLAVVFLWVLIVQPPVGSQSKRPIGIIVAVKAHEAAALGRMSETQSQRLMGRDFVSGSLGGHEVVLVRSPMGKIGVATTATLLVTEFSPRALLSVAPAGSLVPDVGPGDLLLADATVEHDTGSWTDQGLAWPKLRRTRADAGLLSMVRTAATALEVPFAEGSIASGDSFVESSAKALQLANWSGATAVDTSSAAVARVGAWSATPVLLLRWITDRADTDAGLSFDEHAQSSTSATRTADLIEEIVRRWAEQ